MNIWSWFLKTIDNILDFLWYCCWSLFVKRVNAHFSMSCNILYYTDLIQLSAFICLSLFMQLSNTRHKNTFIWPSRDPTITFKLMKKQLSCTEKCLKSFCCGWIYLLFSSRNLFLHNYMIIGYLLKWAIVILYAITILATISRERVLSDRIIA